MHKNICGWGFLSTLSLRRATIAWIKVCIDNADFYPRSPCGERHNINSSVNTADKISIHALLAESDFTALHDILKLLTFLSTLSLRRATPIKQEITVLAIAISIHALLAESDDILSILIIGFLEFLSTLSLRRATSRRCQRAEESRISIHALLAESDNHFRHNPEEQQISIHALLAESDPDFLYPKKQKRHISIHALLAESDLRFLW